jgi:ABC-2 type transport system ATP-binding protein
VAQLEDLHHIRAHRVEIEFAPGTQIPEAAIRSAAGVEDVSVDRNRVTCTVHGSIEPLLAAVRDSKITDLVSTEPSLEEIFLSFYSEPARKALPS